MTMTCTLRGPDDRVTFTPRSDGQVEVFWNGETFDTKTEIMTRDEAAAEYRALLVTGFTT